MVEVVEELDADVLVLGSSANGQLGQVVVGSTADRLLHSSPVPVTIACAGTAAYAAGVGPDRLRLPRYPGVGSGGQADRRSGCAPEVPLRVITCGAGRTMYPPEVGLHAEVFDPGRVGRPAPARCWRSCAPTAWWARTRCCRWSAATAGIRRWTPPNGRRARSSRWAPAAGRHRPGVPRVARHEDHAAQPRSGAGAGQYFITPRSTLICEPDSVAGVVAGPATRSHRRPRRRSRSPSACRSRSADRQVRHRCEGVQIAGMGAEHAEHGVVPGHPGWRLSTVIELTRMLYSPTSIASEFVSAVRPCLDAA